MNDEDQVVPAQPGFFVVEVDSDDGHIMKTPIVAWVVGPNMIANPITPFFSWDADGAWAILMPNGKVMERDQTMHDGLHEWKIAVWKKEQS